MVNKKIIWAILIGIVILAAVLRLWQLGNIPPSPDWDEAAFGYSIPTSRSAARWATRQNSAVAQFPRRSEGEPPDPRSSGTSSTTGRWRPTSACRDAEIPAGPDRLPQRRAGSQQGGRRTAWSPSCGAQEQRQVPGREAWSPPRRPTQLVVAQYRVGTVDCVHLARCRARWSCRRTAEASLAGAIALGLGPGLPGVGRRIGSSDLASLRRTGCRSPCPRQARRRRCRRRTWPSRRRRRRRRTWPAGGAAAAKGEAGRTGEAASGSAQKEAPPEPAPLPPAPPQK